jgi:hypothetical protein
VEFRTAYLKHCQAWQDMVEQLRTERREMAERLLRGARRALVIPDVAFLALLLAAWVLSHYRTPTWFMTLSRSTRPVLGSQVARSHRTTAWQIGRSDNGVESVFVVMLASI